MQSDVVASVSAKHDVIITMGLAQVKAAVSELGDSFAELLGRSRTGVVAALFAAAGRLGCSQTVNTPFVIVPVDYEGRRPF